ncbi:MAG TPA: hypothetical protein VGD80_27625, partial [Kofleriaceae bacterium]
GFLMVRAFAPSFPPWRIRSRCREETVRPVRGLELKKHDVLRLRQRADFDAARRDTADPGH